MRSSLAYAGFCEIYFSLRRIFERKHLHNTPEGQRCFFVGQSNRHPAVYGGAPTCCTAMGRLAMPCKFCYHKMMDNSCWEIRPSMHDAIEGKYSRMQTRNVCSKHTVFRSVNTDTKCAGRALGARWVGCQQDGMPTGQSGKTTIAFVTGKQKEQQKLDLSWRARLINTDANTWKTKKN